jgi:hypothetical protein
VFGRLFLNRGFSLQKDFKNFILKSSALEGRGNVRTEGRCPLAIGIFGGRVNIFCGEAARVQGLCI